MKYPALAAIWTSRKLRRAPPWYFLLEIVAEMSNKVRAVSKKDRR